MADIVLTEAKNWSTCNVGNTPPAEGDRIYLNGTFALTLDGEDTKVYKCVLIRACVSAADTTGKAGTIALGAGTTSCTLDCSIRAGTATMLTIASGKTVAITGTATGGSSASAWAVSVASGGTLSSVGALVGGSAQYSYGAVVAGTLTTATSVVGGSHAQAYGLVNNGGTITTVTATNGSSAAGATGTYLLSGTTTTVVAATGGAVAGAHGVWSTAAAATSTITMATGGSVAGAFGVRFQEGTCNVNGTSLTGVGSPVGITGLRMAAGTAVGTNNVAANADVIFSQQADVASAADVRYGTARYTGGASGTAYIPAAANVKRGVSVDATTGLFVGGSLVGPSALISD